MSEWRESTWGEEISLEYGKSLRDYNTGSGKFRVFGSNGPIGWTSEPLVSGPGVILGRKGAYRGVEFSRDPFFVIDTAYYVVPKTELDMRWLYYAIKHHQLGEIDDGSPIPSTTRAAVYVKDLEVPPLAEQKAVASVLGALDDKIELNRRMNETLEALAQSLFKCWFLDFAPVHNKAFGRKLPSELDSFFPSTFVPSPLGQVPKGWRVAPFEDAFGIPLRNGLTRPKAVRGSGMRMVSMGELFAHRRIGDIEMDRVPLSGEELEKNLLAVGDLLFARQSLTLEGAGQCSIVVGASEPRTYEGHLIRCRLHPQRANYWFFFHYFLSALGRSRITTIVEQVAASGIRASDLARLSLLMPPPEVQHQFGNLVNSFEERIARNNEESRTLAALRDALLPKLLSGELRVPAAAQLVEATV